MIEYVGYSLHFVKVKLSFTELRLGAFVAIQSRFEVKAFA